MSVISTVCPHCSRDVALSVVSTHAVRESSNEFDLFCICPTCGRACVANVKSANSKAFNVQSMPKVIRSSEMLTINIEPKPRIPTSPEFVPDVVSNLYLQGEGSLLAGRFDAAAMTLRRTLEVALKLRWPGMSGSLASRIDQLAELHEITPSLQAWAHSIRLDGNSATHEVDLVEALDAKNILDFTELFLMYVFTLPGMLDQRKMAKV